VDNIYIFDIIYDIIQNYNNCYHRSIKRKPAEVKDRNERIVWETLYGKVYNKVISFKFKEFKDMRFDKGYVENFSEEVLTVIKRGYTTCYKNYWLLIEIRIHYF
jgi:hypothetical protein